MKRQNLVYKYGQLNQRINQCNSQIMINQIQNLICLTYSKIYQQSLKQHKKQFQNMQLDQPNQTQQNEKFLQKFENLCKQQQNNQAQLIDNLIVDSLISFEEIKPPTKNKSTFNKSTEESDDEIGVQNWKNGEGVDEEENCLKNEEQQHLEADEGVIVSFSYGRTVDLSAVYHTFSPYGNISCIVKKSPLIYIKFRTEKSADQAYNNLNKTTLKTNKLNLTYQANDTDIFPKQKQYSQSIFFDKSFDKQITDFMKNKLTKNELKVIISYLSELNNQNYKILFSQSIDYISFLQQFSKYNIGSTKMTTFGYEKERFPNLQGEMFDCIICCSVVKNPKQCSGCGNLFCGDCIDQWKKKNSTCPNRCSGSINSMGSKALQKIYNDLDIQCVKGCKKTIKLMDLDRHQENCGKKKCWNYDICTNSEDKTYGTSCGEQCRVFKQILTTKGNVKSIYTILSKIKPESIKPPSTPMSSYSPSVSNRNQSSSYSSSDSKELKWNSLTAGTGIAFQNNSTTAILKEGAYVFRTVLGSMSFTSGKHYWEILADSRTQNQLKIGVSCSNSFDFNTAFCDHIFGYAYYGLGQLRQNSNASGPQYGKRFKKDGVLGVFLNMDKGQVSFSLNGENMGVAFDHASLKKGPVFPAVSLLHCAGCKIRGELPIPSCFK